MRVVGGRFRGRPLAGPKSDAIRPTSDRLRETIFNVLAHGYGDPIEGARVIDLFAGTGAMGIEALSRGAAFCLFVDEGAPLAALLARLRAERRATPPHPLRAYVDRLLAAFAPPGPAFGPAASGRIPTGPSPALPEPLTPREREVLCLIADGLSNPEIAARLFVGVGTVKSYVNGVFGKLGATSRIQAVARARSLGLLPDQDPALR